MNKAEALAAFFQKNAIDYERALDKSDGNYDRRIAALPEQVDSWLSGIAEEDHDVFLTLLSRYTYLSQAQCRLRYDRILSLLEERLTATGNRLSEVLFVTVESGGAYASGGDNVRTDVLGRNFYRLTKKQIVAAQSKLGEEDLTPYKVVVFLDDIIGSGISLWGAIRTFCDRFSVTGEKDGMQLFFACIAPRKEGVRHVKDNCRKAHILIKPLFDTAWYQEPAFPKNSPPYLKLEQYEKLVGTYMMPEGESFFMGFQKNRLLLSFYYNTPNNTLCTFWRVGPDLIPPFYRDGNQAPSRPKIGELKTRKEQKRDLAYQYGIDRRRKEDGRREETAIR